MKNDILTQKIIGYRNRGSSKTRLNSIAENRLSETSRDRCDLEEQSHKGQRFDVLVENEVIVEIKSLSKLADFSMHKFCLI